MCAKPRYTLGYPTIRNISLDFIVVKIERQFLSI
nr:MAG TPA: hypothetical protein [Caudoviricetes sp.]